MQLTVSLLGPLEVRTGGAPLQLGGARLRTLLSRLALDPGRTVTTTALLDALWADEPPEGAANALQSLVSRLRKSLGDPALVAATPGGYRLDLTPDSVDTVRFEALFRQGRNALTNGDAATAHRLLRDALALWRGPALADLTDAPFAAAPAARLDELRLAALCDRLDADLRLGRHAEALPELEALATEHPLRENIAALLVRALYAAGRQADALAAYERVRSALAEQLGIDPAKELADVHLAVLRNDPALTPAAAAPEPGAGPTSSAPSIGGPAPAAAPPAPRTNLRTALTSFVGRDEEVARIGKLLEEYRLVTLVGPGGAGKTRLAGESAARVLDHCPDGVWLVELAPVTDPAEVAQAVLGSLGPRQARVMTSTGTSTVPRGSTLSHLLEHLDDKHTLLILDNCEHLVEAAAEIAETLLGHCPGLRILATSREPLGILGESLYPVPPLSQPSDTPAVTEALGYPAVRLFADRAAAVQPGFAVDAANVADVVAICRRLDGLPLAIELAAARLRTLPAHQIAARLGDRFRLLTGGSRTAMPRHQTLRAVVAWSWELLSEAERDLAERLSVFPGGVTASAAAAVVPGATPEEMFDLLSALVDKSLLQPVATNPEEEPRFRMLETLREYGAERLDATGELAGIRRAHARFFCELAETAEPQLRRADQLTWLARLNAERDNVFAALRFAADDGDADTAVRIAAALAWYWTLGDQNEQSRMWLRTALETPGTPSESARVPYTVVRVMERISSVFADEQWDQAHLLGAQLSVLVDGVDQAAHPILALVDAIGPMLADDPEGLKAALVKHADHPDPWVVAMLYMLRGMSAENAGDRSGVAQDLAEALRRFTELGDRWGKSAALNGLASIALTQGDDAKALELQTEAIELIRDINATTDAAQIQMTRALILARMGQPETALGLLEEILETGLRSGSETTILVARLGLAEAYRLSGQSELGWQHMRESEARTDDGWRGPPQVLAVRDVSAALLHLADGDLAQSRDRLQRAWRRALATRDMPVQARVAVAMACYVHAEGDARTATHLLGCAERLLGAADRGDTDRGPLLTRLAAELPPAEFEACYAAGRDGTREESQALLARSVGIVDDPSDAGSDGVSGGPAAGLPVGLPGDLATGASTGVSCLDPSSADGHTLRL